MFENFKAKRKMKALAKEMGQIKAAKDAIADPDDPRAAALDGEWQRLRGLYEAEQLALIRRMVARIQELHQAIEGRPEVTPATCIAVAEFAMTHHDGTFCVNRNGQPLYEISVKPLLAHTS
jgi:hypothetical protein